MILEDLQFRIPDRLFDAAESLHVSGQIAQDTFAMGPDTYVFDGPIEWQADLTNTGNALLIDGTATATATVGCSRCLEPTVYDLSGQIEGYFLIKAEGEEDVLDDEEEFDLLPEDGILDLESLVMGALALEMPLMPLCDEDCKGLCPDCGCNLNQGECACAQNKPVDPTNPFAALAGLTFD